MFAQLTTWLRPLFLRTARRPSIASGGTRFVHGAALACSIAAAGTGVANMRLAAVDLADLSLEQLGNVVVTSVSRRPQAVGSAPASIYVITGDDIRRSGVTSVPEALRLAPNLHVARVDTNQYGITARGSNSVLQNKLLVMVDGRTVYSPIFSGVFWETLDVVLEDVDRIEVISGPGATLWGLNAVNGVINIITRTAHATRGVLAEAGAGNRERGAHLRAGTSLGQSGAVRVYAKAFERDARELVTGQPIRDESDHGQVGFRYDATQSAHGWTLQGDAYSSRIDQTPAARELSGANLLTRWSTPLAERTDLTLQAYYDLSRRSQPGAFEQKLDTVDATVQLGMRPAAAHRLLLGAGYRLARDRTEAPGPAFAFIPLDKTLQWGHAFAQDEVELRPDLRLTVGAKIETNVYTGGEFLPNVRLAWQPDDNRLLWAAVSRSVRAPARVDRDFYQPARPPHFILDGGPNFESEVANVAELGYRAQRNDTLYWSATVFHHDFDRLRSVEPRATGQQLENLLQGTVTGIEAWAEWRVVRAWRLAIGGVSQHVEFEREPASRDVASLASLSFDPSGWWSVRSRLDLPAAVEFDVMVRRVGDLTRARIPGYTAFDARLGWRPRPELELSLTVQNAFDPGHAEWGPTIAPAEHPRTAFVRAIWRQ